MKKPSIINSNQKGFTLIEMLIAVAIAGIIGAAATMAVHQVITIPTISNDHNIAINQVRNAVHWISRDAVAAQTVNATLSNPKFLELTRTDWDDDELHTTTYSFESMPDGLNNLKRSETDNTGTKTITIAQYIESKATGITECSWDAINGVLTVTITATVNDITETREFEVNPRPID